MKVLENMMTVAAGLLIGVLWAAILVVSLGLYKYGI